MSISHAKPKEKKMANKTIVYAVEMLHYLPLYLAYERDLESRFEIEHCGGDKTAIDRLMSDFSQDQSVCFAVCDPMMVNLATTYRSDDYPVVIAQVVQKVPFWAINHKCDELQSMEEFDRFTEIYAYQKPNTGYVFGEIIHKCCAKGRHDKIAFKPNKPPDAPIEEFLTHDRAVLIEADILKIRKYEEVTKHRRIFAFPEQKRFRHFCFTALVTRRKYLDSLEGQSDARKLLEALILASYTIYHDHSTALECASRWFGGYSRQIVSNALRILTDQEVFSKSLVVSYWGWEKNIAIQRQVNAEFKYPRFRRYVDNDIVRTAYYNHIKGQVDGRFLLFRNFWDFPWVRRTGEVAALMLAAFVPAFFIGFRALIQNCFKPALCMHWSMVSIFALIYYFRGWLSIKTKVDPSDWARLALELAIMYTEVEFGLIRELLGVLSA
jgi:hypothetical protein